MLHNRNHLKCFSLFYILYLLQGEGCALMGKMTKYENIVRCMNSVLDIPLTVKMRTGLTDNKNTAHMLIPRLRDAGVSLVTVSTDEREGG